MRLSLDKLKDHRRVIQAKLPGIKFDEIADIYDSEHTDLNLICLRQLTDKQKLKLGPEYSVLDDRHSDVWFGWITTVRYNK